MQMYRGGERRSGGGERALALGLAKEGVPFILEEPPALLALGRLALVLLPFPAPRLTVLGCALPPDGTPALGAGISWVAPKVFRGSAGYSMGAGESGAASAVVRGATVGSKVADRAGWLFSPSPSASGLGLGCLFLLWMLPMLRWNGVWGWLKCELERGKEST